MVEFFLYLVIGGVAGVIFKWIASLVELFFLFGIGGVLTKFSTSIDEKIEMYPKRMFFVILLNNVTIGSINALMIFIITFNFMLKFNGNFWLYVITSIFWSLLILSYTPTFVGMYFMTSTVSLILMWLGFSIIAQLIIAPITFIVSLAYYYGRINVVLEEEQVNKINL
jgi:hypothetical protein